MKQTSEQYFNNLPEEPETYFCSGCYCPPTQPPQGYYTCPNCEGTGDLGGEYYYDENDEEEYYRRETCDTCKGKGYITLKELNKWNKKLAKVCCVSAYMESDNG